MLAQLLFIFYLNEIFYNIALSHKWREKIDERKKITSVLRETRSRIFLSICIIMQKHMNKKNHKCMKEKNLFVPFF